MSTAAPFFLDPTSLATHVSAATYSRGLAVYRSQQVLECGVSRASTAEWCITGEVQGSERMPYESTALLEADANGRVLTFQGECSCPVGQDCKHAVALTLKAAYRSRRPPSGSAALPVQVLPEQARPDAANAQLTQWLDLFELDAPPSPLGAQPIEDSLVFLLHRPTQERRGEREAARPLLSWGLSHPLRRGNGWTRVRTPSYYGGAPTRNATPDELECLRLIGSLSASSYGYGGGQSAALRGHVGLLALRLAALSGRLFLVDKTQEIKGTPLRWGAERSIQWRWDELAQSGANEPIWRLHAFLDTGQL